MYKLSIVGDLSFNDPNRLAQALDAALSNSDIVIQVGDLHPGYDVVKSRLSSGKLLVVPGNHDTEWDTRLELPRQWKKEIPGVTTLIGLDNSADIINQDGWDVLNSFTPNGLALFLFMHKPLSTLVLPDGSESNHIMGEGSSCPDAIKLQDWMLTHHASMACGHYHGYTIMDTRYATILLDGRGGAAPQIGYTVVYIQSEGWTAHSVSL